MAAIPVNTVQALLTAAGVDDIIQFNAETSAKRMARDMFDNDLASFIDKTHDEIDSDLKTCANLTVAQGHSRIHPGEKHVLKAVLQWVKDIIRTSLDPTIVSFPVFDVALLMRRHKIHTFFTKKSVSMTATAMPAPFTPSMKWSDWVPTFLNFLRTIPGRDGVPLDYICRSDVLPNRTLQTNILKEYVEQAPLSGDSFTSDTTEVHTYLANLITAHPTAESKTKSSLALKNGRPDFFLEDHFKGIGVHSRDILNAENTLETLFYAGEKRPHMWWDKFESELTSSFTSFDLKERRSVHSDQMKLRILLKKVNADFLQQTKAALKVEMTRIPMIMTYDMALANFRNTVNEKYINNQSPHRTQRNIQEITQRGCGSDGRHRCRFGG